MRITKYHKYEEFNREKILCDGIADMLPYTIELPKPPSEDKIINFGLPPEEQFFQRVKIPNEIKRINLLSREEQQRVIDKNASLARFIEEQWRKRYEGEWQWVNGKLLYLTGVNWSYLNYCNIDIGLPYFRTTDMEFFWWWEYCVVGDERATGGINFTRRREGKTYKGGWIVLEYVSRNAESQGGLQSKTNTDAVSAFSKAIVRPWRRLPFYFSPIFDNGTNPKKELTFRQSGKRGKSIDIEQMISGKELNSWIQARPSVAEAFDGEKLHRIFTDEPGKTTEYDVNEQYSFVRPCLEQDGVIIGKALYSTTVEDMERKGGANFKELFEKSSRDKITELGQTETGLVQFFTPSYRNYKFNQWGFPVINTPTKQEQAYLKKIKDPNWNKGGLEIIESTRKGFTNGAERQAYIRKFPNTIREAFRSSAKDCLFDLNIINDRLEEFVFKNKYTTKGNFKWRDDKKDTEVIFVPAADGRWEISYQLPQERSNMIVWQSGKKYPANADKFTAGADPFKYNSTSANKPSKGATYIWAYYDHSVDQMYDDEFMVTDDFIAEYLYRPSTKEIYCEDVLMACVYYGCQVFPEINVPAVWDHFISRGYENYLKYEQRPVRKGGFQKLKTSAQPGATTVGDKIKSRMFATMESYVQTHGHRCKFPNLLEALRDVQYDDVSPYDAFVAAAYARMGMTFIKKYEEKKYNTGSFMTLREL